MELDSAGSPLLQFLHWLDPDSSVRVDVMLVSAEHDSAAAFTVQKKSPAQGGAGLSGLVDSSEGSLGRQLGTR